MKKRLIYLAIAGICLFSLLLAFLGGISCSRYVKFPYLHIPYSIPLDSDIVVTYEKILSDNHIEYALRDNKFKKERQICIELYDFHLMNHLVDHYNTKKKEN